MQENEIVATKWLFFIVLGSFGKKDIIVIYKVKQSKIISSRKVVSVYIWTCVCGGVNLCVCVSGYWISFNRTDVSFEKKLFSTLKVSNKNLSVSKWGLIFLKYLDAVTCPQWIANNLKQEN